MILPLVSIIVPVYNTEKYLLECIDSILEQSFKDFELILVDDGSSDNSLSICRNASLQDSRIKVIGKENGGVSSARNIGIESAVGKFITFIDSDDLVDREYLDKMISQIADDIVLIQSGLYFFDNSSSNQIGQEILTNSFFDGDKPYDCYRLAVFPLITSPVAKLYRREIISGQNIRFNALLSYGEDRDFNLQYIQFVKKAVSISYAGYYYRKGLDGSLSCDRDCIKLLNCDLIYWDKLRAYLQAKQYSGKMVDTYLANRLFNFYNDRLIHYCKSGATYTDLIKVLETLVDSCRYDWLCRHTGLVNCGIIFKLVYKSKSALLMASLFKLTF